MLQKSNRILKKCKSENIFDIVESDKKGWHCLAEHFQTLSVRVKLSPNQDLKVKRSQNQDGLYLFHSGIGKCAGKLRKQE